MTCRSAISSRRVFVLTGVWLACEKKTSTTAVNIIVIGNNEGTSSVLTWWCRFGSNCVYSRLHVSVRNKWRSVMRTKNNGKFPMRGVGGGGWRKSDYLLMNWNWYLWCYLIALFIKTSLWKQKKVSQHENHMAVCWQDRISWMISTLRL